METHNFRHQVIEVDIGREKLQPSAKTSVQAFWVKGECKQKSKQEIIFCVNGFQFSHFGQEGHRGRKFEITSRALRVGRLIERKSLTKSKMVRGKAFSRGRHLSEGKYEIAKINRAEAENLLKSIKGSLHEK